MADINAKAPKKRSGDDINPVLASIIKISALVVIAALVVLTTFIIVEIVNRKKEVKEIFEDKHYITVGDFSTIVSENSDYVDISDEEIRSIVMDLNDSDEIYFYFYYSSLEKKLDKDLIKLINEIELDKPLFIVDLDSDSTEEGAVTFNNTLRNNEHLNERDIANILDLTQNKEKKYQSFLIKFNKEELDATRNPFVIQTNDKMVTDLENLKKLEN